MERKRFCEVTKMVGVTEGNEKIYDVAWGYKRVGTIVGTVVGTRRVFWCFRALFYEVLRMEKDGKNKKNQPLSSVLPLNNGWFGGVREI